jgi:hypothetical protein
MKFTNHLTLFILFFLLLICPSILFAQNTSWNRYPVITYQQVQPFNRSDYNAPSDPSYNLTPYNINTVGLFSRIPLYTTLGVAIPLQVNAVDFDTRNNSGVVEQVEDAVNCTWKYVKGDYQNDYYTPPQIIGSGTSINWTPPLPGVYTVWAVLKNDRDASDPRKDQDQELDKFYIVVADNPSKAKATLHVWDYEDGTLSSTGWTEDEGREVTGRVNTFVQYSVPTFIGFGFDDAAQLRTLPLFHRIYHVPQCTIVEDNMSKTQSFTPSTYTRYEGVMHEPSRNESGTTIGIPVDTRFFVNGGHSLSYKYLAFIDNTTVQGAITPIEGKPLQGFYYTSSANGWYRKKNFFNIAIESNPKPITISNFVITNTEPVNPEPIKWVKEITNTTRLPLPPALSCTYECKGVLHGKGSITVNIYKSEGGPAVSTQTIEIKENAGTVSFDFDTNLPTGIYTFRFDGQYESIIPQRSGSYGQFPALSKYTDKSDILTVNGNPEGVEILSSTDTTCTMRLTYHIAGDHASTEGYIDVYDPDFKAHHRQTLQPSELTLGTHIITFDMPIPQSPGEYTFLKCLKDDAGERPSDIPEINSIEDRLRQRKFALQTNQKKPFFQAVLCSPLGEALGHPSVISTTLKSAGYLVKNKGVLSASQILNSLASTNIFSYNGYGSYDYNKQSNWYGVAHAGPELNQTFPSALGGFDDKSQRFTLVTDDFTLFSNVSRKSAIEKLGQEGWMLPTSIRFLSDMRVQVLNTVSRPPMQKVKLAVWMFCYSATSGNTNPKKIGYIKPPLRDGNFLYKSLYNQGFYFMGNVVDESITNGAQCAVGAEGLIEQGGETTQWLVSFYDALAGKLNPVTHQRGTPLNAKEAFDYANSKNYPRMGPGNLILKGNGDVKIK